MAQTLIQIKENGSKAFYYGVIAQELIKEGYVTKEDLQNYDVKEQETIKVSFNGYDIVTAPPPFSGITLIQIFNMIEYMDVPRFDENTVKNVAVVGPLSDVWYKDWYCGIPPYEVTVLDGIREAFPNAKISHETGLSEIRIRLADQTSD